MPSRVQKTRFHLDFNSSENPPLNARKTAMLIACGSGAVFTNILGKGALSICPSL